MPTPISRLRRMVKKGVRVARRARGADPRPRTVEIHEPLDALQYAYWIERRPLRMMLPTSMLRIQGGFTYGSEHPFVQALEHGSERLAGFYTGFQPDDLAGMYDLARTGRTGEGLPPWELPWILRNERTPPRGEGLPADHGLSLYGPVSEAKLALEMRRLKTVTESIRKNGFQPDRHGDIRGHLMTDGTEVCFFVRRGKHRAAALAFLGYETIPVQFRRIWPLTVDTRTADGWPLVSSGDVAADLATDILDTYLHGRCWHPTPARVTNAMSAR